MKTSDIKSVRDCMFYMIDSYDLEEHCVSLFGEINLGDRVAMRRKMSLRCEGHFASELTSAQLTQLAELLSDKSFDFEWFFNRMEGAFTFPDTWAVGNWRNPAEDMYAVAYFYWRRREPMDDSVPHPNQLGIEAFHG
jgi:hypothetical protein